MTRPIKTVVIVGGGSAGWITAGLLASKHRHEGNTGLNVVVIESPDIPTVGVGEGTWPTMRTTLRSMGIRELDFVKKCGVSFKQGSKFCRWRRDDSLDFYYHPFDPPQGFGTVNIAEHWLASAGNASFSLTVCPQEQLCESHLAPKLPTSPDYAGFANYGYHLDAGAFSIFLRDHCVEKLGVRHVADTMTGIKSASDGDIEAVETREHGAVAGDLFIDCTGFRALLIGEHFGVGMKSMSHVLFPDTALAVQVSYDDGDPVQSATVSTAQPAGWIWDVSLEARRGIGHVYSSAHMSEEAAIKCLQNYLGKDEKAFAGLNVRKLSIGSGYREIFWAKNCVAVGLSAGFLEPLEASALMLIEKSANLIADNMPTTRRAMDIVSKHFNERLSRLWQHILHFLKLHYYLSERTEPFWIDNRRPESLPHDLLEDLTLWAEQVPRSGEFGGQDEVFPAASYQYVLYGMGFNTKANPRGMQNQLKAACAQEFEAVARNTERLKGMLPSNRALLDMFRTAPEG
ncbi:tryptophan halogenase family protein [Kordiimonas sp.]|uniref:tryptophan halogenase family protein n=1 Tax=Kordiimonas sp. TaxID=1970157 RepID=UPI003A9246A4